MAITTLARYVALASTVVSFVAVNAQVTGTFPAVPLVSKHFTFPGGVPQQVDTDQGLIRGTQLGYNICNSTTENQNSLCQTAFFNDATDFCLWGPPMPGKTVGEIEGEMVAWCSKPGHGTRLIPAGALTGIQFLKSPDYIQIVGFFDQTQIDMVAGDFGGEMDPHGADLRGNPLGGIMFSNNFSGGSSFVQVIEWTNFLGSNFFCLKACDPAGPNAANFCQHIYDRIGCAFNAPNNAQNGPFESCQAENADFPGVFTSNGVVMTYTQPPESLGPITSVPFVARVPSSSNCVTLNSASVFAGLPTASTSSSASSSTTGSATGTKSGSGATGTPKPGQNNTGGAGEVRTVVMSSVLALVGVVGSALLLS